MSFGLSKQQFQFIENTVVAPLRAAKGQVYVYGSRARGDHSRFSDLDLMAEAYMEGYLKDRVPFGEESN